MEKVIHPWGAVFNKDSKVLVLGTFPSPRSRKEGFPFGHPQNVFWSALADSLGVQRINPDASRDERYAFILSNNVAIWDVLHSCEIDGASDASIKNPVANKFRPIIEASNISAVFTTGRKATDLFNELCVKEAGMRAVYLPSTSPANRATQAKPLFGELWGNVGRLVRGELVSAYGMKAFDRNTIESHGVPSMVLMERAALAVAEELAGFNLSRVICVCGAGNNGGDGIAVARLLHLARINAEILFVGDKKKMSVETQRQYAIAKSYDVPIHENKLAILSGATTIVDAMFGIGLTRGLSSEFLDTVKAVNKFRAGGAKVLSIDIPSGVSADTGEILGGANSAVSADITVTFAYNKIGLTIEPGRTAAGRIIIKDIGII
jgi:hypoxanthine-DNA glycosylase